MTPAFTAAAERLITLPGFRWMPGMRDVEGRRFVGAEAVAKIEHDRRMFEYCGPYGCLANCTASLPDLTDPATRGCVLAMVREAWQDPLIYVATVRLHVWGGESAIGYTPYTVREGFGAAALFTPAPYGQVISEATEAECLVNALAAAAGAK